MTNPDRCLRSPWVGCFLLLSALGASCASSAPTAEVEGAVDALSQGDYECEKAKRECLVSADCDPDQREACETTFHDCKYAVKEDKDAQHQVCHAAKETCEAGAADDAAWTACHTEEHRCMLPVEPPEAVCHIQMEECLVAAGIFFKSVPEPKDPMMDPMDPMGAMGPKMPKPEKSDAEIACRDEEKVCKDAMRLDKDELPKPPHCDPGPPPPATCAPEPPKP